MLRRSYSRLFKTPERGGRENAITDGKVGATQVTIDKAGRLVIPKKIREKAYIKPGMKLDIHLNDGRIEIEPAAEPINLVRQGRFLVAVSPPGTPKMTHDEFEQVRQEIYLERERAILGLDPDAGLPT